MTYRLSLRDFLRRTIMLGMFLALILNAVITFFIAPDGSLVSEAGASYNEMNFRKSSSPLLATVWVAVSTGVGMKSVDLQNAGIEIDEAVMSLQQYIADRETGRNALMATHMRYQSEYAAILRTDVNNLLDSASDRASTLEAFTDTLKYRYRTTQTLLSQLGRLSQSLTSSMTSASSRAAASKAALSKNYGAKDAEKTGDSLDEYLKAKEEYEYARTYLVFVNRFAATYQRLNDYNKKLLDTVINNREALIKNAKIVLPDSGTDLLRKMDLVESEAEYKSGQ